MSAAHPAWEALDRGQPQQALRCWRSQLLAGWRQIEPCLAAAQQSLPADPLAVQRRRVLRLLQMLAATEPGEAECLQLGGVLRGWGVLCLSHAPATAQRLLERAWVCGGDPELEQYLADLYARQGMPTGAWALAPPQPELPPWPVHACAGLHCQPCALQLWSDPLPPEPSLALHSFSGGSIWIERHPPLAETHGVAVADAEGRLEPSLCRRYPGHWPACQFAAQECHQNRALLAPPQPPPLQLAYPVLAVADLSAELHYHAQLELLPRLGRAWQQLAPQLPGLWLWHNGGSSPALREALVRLGVPADRILCAHRHPHLQAATLLVPGYPSAFGRPGPRSLAWLRCFWGEAEDRSPTAPSASRWLVSRSTSQRRPLLQHQRWLETGQFQSGPHPTSPMVQQLQRLQSAGQVWIAHGGAMVNLLLAPAGAEVIELVNPAYAPPYIASLVASGGLRHRQRLGAPTPQVLQDLLYAGPLEWPIDLEPPVR